MAAGEPIAHMVIVDIAITATIGASAGQLGCGLIKPEPEPNSIKPCKDEVS
jgi:hypothetical protein